MFYEYEIVEHFEGTGVKAFMVSINERLFHWHNDFEIIQVIEGSIKVQTSGTEYALEKDDVFLLNRYEVHSLMQTNEPNTLIAIQFNSGFCTNYFPRLQTTRFGKKKLAGSEDATYGYAIRQSIVGIFFECCKDSKFVSFDIMSHLNLLVKNLLAYFSPEQNTEDDLINAEKKILRISRILDYIQENYTQRITLKEIAEREHLDMAYLSHLIKEQLGISFQAYLRKIRLQKAIQLVLNGYTKKTDICFESGFSDFKYLSAAFIQEYGYSFETFPFEREERKINDPKKNLYSQHHLLKKAEAIKKIQEYLKK